MNIVCAMPFYHELDLLEIKLASMADFVDTFVIGEATRTFMGIIKPLYFEESKARFARYPIKHVVIDDPVGGGSPWDREDQQRKRIAVETLALAPDVVIMCDTDEVVTKGTVDRFLESKWQTAALELNWMLYYFNRQRPQWWKQRAISRDKQCWTMCHASMPTITNAGWHFNFCLPRSQLLDKVNATSHAIESHAPQFWSSVRKGECPGLESTIEYPEDKLPHFIRAHRKQFADLFYPT